MVGGKVSKILKENMCYILSLSKKKKKHMIRSLNVRFFSFLFFENVVSGDIYGGFTKCQVVL